MGHRTREKDLHRVLPSLGRLLVRFHPYIRPQRGLIASSLLALLADTALRLLQPWPLKFIFDRVLVADGVTATGGLPPMVALAGLSLAVVAIALLSAGAGYLSKLGMALATVRILAAVRERLFSHLQRLSLSFHYQFSSGDLITRVIADIERLRTVTINAVVPFITSLLTLIAMVGVMLWMNWQLALIAIALFPVFMGLVHRLITRIRAAARRHRHSEGNLAATASETLGAIQVVQALSLHQAVDQVFGEENQENLSQSTVSLRLSALLNRSIQVLMALLVALVLWRGSQLVLADQLTPGDLLIFITYIKESFDPPMRKFANQVGQMAKAAASGERVMDILDYQPQVRDLPGARPAPALQGAVRFQQVSFGYDPDYPVLHDLSFAVEPGQKVAITGPSGSGKSTLMHLLLRLYDPVAGRITVDGCDMRDYQLESLRQQISVVLQDSLLFAASVWENIAFGKTGATEADIIRAARLANAHEFILQLPQGYDTRLGERGSTLSGGQRQRLAIARAAIRQAPILILDEPTTGLDRASEQQVNGALERLSQGRTTFVISHDLRAVETADVILYLEGGRLLEQGTHPQLLRLGGHYAALYHLQTAVDSAPIEV